MANLKGKVAVVTGGSSGIGKAIAERFAKDGAYVVIVGRKEGPLQEVAATNEKIRYVAGNVTKTETIEKVIAAVEKEFGRLDILVNNAGWCPVKPITEMTIADYDRAFQLDVRALVELTIHALPMLRRARGNIINLSSVGSTHRSKNLSMYQGAKAAVDNFTRVWALELARDGVRVNAIAPAPSAPTSGTCPAFPRRRQKNMRTALPPASPLVTLARRGYCKYGGFLVSDEARYISGGIFAVDGAMGAV